MPRDLVLIRQVILTLSLWIAVGGLAAVNCVNLPDEVAQPPLPLVQLIDPELDEVDDEGSTAAAAVPARLDAAGGGQAIGLFNSVASRSAPTARPLYLKLAQYRI
jgi:hypothetical protein